MSAFSESAFLKKLSELNSSQQSIQTLSLWLIHHRKHHPAIVKTWLRELQNGSENKKLIFMYLANDVIQNSKKKGPEYGKEFATVLGKVFTHIGLSCTSERLFGSLGRLLNIWKERGVYEPKIIEEYRARLNKEQKSDTEKGNEENAGSTSNNNNNQTNNNNSNGNVNISNKEKSDKKRKAYEEVKMKTKQARDEKHAAGTAASAAAATAAGSTTSAGTSIASTTTPSSTPGGDSAATQSPYTPLGDPPEPEELIKALMSIENSASSDANMRERIANLPPEISEVTCLHKLEDKEQAKALQNKVNEAVQLLTEYNGRLAVEMEERTKLANMLRNFQAEQKELLSQAELRLEEYKRKLNKILALKKELRDHLINLPDLTQLPDVTGGLAPLPSAGDLFNIHL